MFSGWTEYVNIITSVVALCGVLGGVFAVVRRMFRRLDDMAELPAKVDTLETQTRDLATEVAKLSRRLDENVFTRWGR